MDQKGTKSPPKEKQASKRAIKPYDDRSGYGGFFLFLLRRLLRYFPPPVMEVVYCITAV